MKTLTSSREARLLPAGIPRYVRCYDNGGETADRYTVVFTGRAKDLAGGGRTFLSMSDDPASPGGFGQHGESARPLDVDGSGWAPGVGKRCRLGRRITFSTLPAACQRLVLSSYRAIWGLPDGMKVAA